MREVQAMTGNESPFMRNLGKYRKPKAGEKVCTDYGMAEILKVKDYHEVVAEMESDDTPKDEMDGFAFRVEHFLIDRKKYFECLIRYDDGDYGMIDWSEYLALKKRWKREKVC
jgi:hypothetical protein